MPFKINLIRSGMKTSKRVLSVALLTSFFFLITCSQKEHTPTLDENGIEIISNPEYGIWQDMEVPPFKFELLNEITLDDTEELIIGSIRHLITDNDGNIYFLDSRQSKLISLKPDGSLRWAIGQEGKGPGDFESPTGMTTDGDYLYIGNIQGSRLDMFGYSGNFVKSTPFSKDLNFASPMGFTSSGELLVSTPYWGGFGRILSRVAISDTLQVLDTFTIDQSDGLEISENMSSSASIALTNDKIISGGLSDYSIKFYDLEGNLETILTRDFDRIVRPGTASSGGGSMIMGFGGVEPPNYIQNEYFIIKASWPTNISDPDQFARDRMNGGNKEPEMRNSLDLFDPSGNLLYSIESEGYTSEHGSLTHIDRNGIMYFIYNDGGYTIRKYSIQFSEG